MDAVILGVQGLLAPHPLPETPDSGSEAVSVLRAAVRDLADTAPVVLLDAGPCDALEAWSQSTGLATLATFRLWTGRLGGQAKAPSRLPFRFVARRLDVACGRTLFVGADPGALEAARRSGCQTWDLGADTGADVPESIRGPIDWIRESVAA